MNDLNKYAASLVNMANWDKTTVIRTYYKLKPHVMEKKLQKLAARKNVDRIFASLEPDHEKLNHLHLALAGRNITKRQISNSMRVEEKHILNIEKIRDKKQCLQYVSKHLIREQRYIDAYHTIY